MKKQTLVYDDLAKKWVELSPVAMAHYEKMRTITDEIEREIESYKFYHRKPEPDYEYEKKIKHDRECAEAWANFPHEQWVKSRQSLKVEKEAMAKYEAYQQRKDAMATGMIGAILFVCLCGMGAMFVNDFSYLFP